MNPNADASVEIILKALQFENADAAAQLAVRTAAAEAVGHSTTVTSELLYKYQLQQRLDVRAQGAGTIVPATENAAEKAADPVQ
jgi:hypothetical protein